MEGDFESTSFEYGQQEAWKKMKMMILLDSLMKTEENTLSLVEEGGEESKLVTFIWESSVLTNHSFTHLWVEAVIYAEIPSILLLRRLRATIDCVHR